LVARRVTPQLHEGFEHSVVGQSLDIVDLQSPGNTVLAVTVEQPCESVHLAVPHPYEQPTIMPHQRMELSDPHHSFLPDASAG
jgi:hypothetical protein